MADSPKRKRIGLVQINNSFSGQNYLPLSAGMLQVYAEKHAEHPAEFEFLTPIYSRIPVDEAVKRLSRADVVGFSSYVWNFKISLEIAGRLKAKKKKTLIVFGGPHVPDRNPEEFLRKYPFIDIACHGEGEVVFLNVLKYGFTDRSQIPSASFLDTQGNFVQTTRVPRSKELEDIPSPYLEGAFENLIAENPNERWIAMWETNRGCPFSCTFCDWGSATASKINKWNIDRLLKEIEWFADHRIEYVFCADANFGILPRDLEIAAHLAKIKSEQGYPKAVSIQATKNAQERSYLVQKTLAEAGMNKAVVVSMQSLHVPTLKAIKRDNISLDAFKNLQIKFSGEGIETMTDLILGQPEETYESWVAGVDTLLNLGQHNRIQFNNLSILPNAEMGDSAYQKRYGMETVISAVVNIHGSLPASNEIVEMQELVIATSATPRADWVRMRAFSWMTSLLHFDKLFQIPLIVLHQATGLGYGEMLEYFSEGKFSALADMPDEFPILREVRQFFIDKSTDIQNGGAEYCHSAEWLNIYWPADEYIFIKLCTEGKLQAFYAEAEEALKLFLRARSIELDETVLSDAVRLNKELMKMPFQTANAEVRTSWNIFEVFRSVVLGKPVPFRDESHKHLINKTQTQWNSWEEWFEKVVWFGNRKGAYLYGNVPDEIFLEGHFD